MAAVTPGSTSVSEGRKVFFFEKKQQKTFANRASAFPATLSLDLSRLALGAPEGQTTRWT
jgi:hypothetical protein